APAKIRKLFGIGEGQIVAISFSKEKPVATPRNITANRAHPRNVYDERTFGAPTGDVRNRNFTIFVECGRNDSDPSFNAMLAGRNAANVEKSGNEADGSMTANAEITYVVEENDSGATAWIGRFEKTCADNDIRAAGFIDDRGAE